MFNSQLEEDSMKKGPRCPVCGSIHIKETAKANTADKTSGTDNDKDASKCNPSWKCYDCYRNFDKPDESM